MRKIVLLFLIGLSAFAQTEETIVSGNSKLHYRIFGSGAPILFINGGPGLTSDGFADLAKTMSMNNKIILYDQRGTGKSPLAVIDKKTVTMDLMVQDIENLRKHLNIDNWIVLGHSFGGMLASHYASIHPEHIKGIIMSSAGGIDLELRNYVNQKIRKMLSKSQLISLDDSNRKISKGDRSVETRMKRATAMAHAYAYDKKFIPEIAKRLAVVNIDINNLVWADLEKINFDCSNKFKSFAAPVLVIQGRNDLLDIKTAEKIHKAFPNAKLVLIDKCGHYGWLDAPEAYFSAINQFLKTV